MENGSGHDRRNLLSRIFVAHPSRVNWSSTQLHRIHAFAICYPTLSKTLQASSRQYSSGSTVAAWICDADCMFDGNKNPLSLIRITLKEIKKPPLARSPPPASVAVKGFGWGQDEDEEEDIDDEVKEDDEEDEYHASGEFQIQ
ncbi:hypothetical protein GQ457_14G002470 [Hibiscus cannabinus]